jgi:cation transport regulator ChaC
MKNICFNIALIATMSIANISLNAQFEPDRSIMEQVGAKLPDLSAYPSYRYPNEDHASLQEQFPSGKVLVFSYGSLMNKQSAARSAFGVKRIFNYKSVKTDHWGADQNTKEKAMLNLIYDPHPSSLANGVTMEVDLEDLNKLVQRETGYDLVPILVSSWQEVREQNPALKIQVAYTFIATNELRNHVNYTSTEFYPVRGYLHAVQNASKEYGDAFAEMWNETTFLADGTTNINEWDETTFNGVLCTKTP